MNEPRWTPDFADEEGRIRTLVYTDRDGYRAFLYGSDIHIGALSHVQRGRAMEALVAAVRDADTLRQARELAAAVYGCLRRINETRAAFYALPDDAPIEAIVKAGAGLPPARDALEDTIRPLLDLLAPAPDTGAEPVPQAEVDKIHEAELRSYGFEPAPDTGAELCANCGHYRVRHKIGRCSMCSQGCSAFAEPVPDIGAES